MDTKVVEDGMNAMVELVSTWGLQVIGAIAVLIIGRMAAGLVRRGVGRALVRAKTDPTLVPFVSGMAYYLVLAAVLIAVLNLFGIQTASLIAVMGAAGLAIGLAMQGTLSNFSAGVMLLLFRPFGVDDFVEVGGSAGGVEAIGLFSTTLNTPDNVKIIVPNSSIFGQTIKNYSANDTRRLDMVFGISYDDDIDKAIATIRSVVEADARVLQDPEVTIAVSELGDSSVNLVVRPWCKRQDYWALKFDLTQQLKTQVEEAGCSIPYPQRDVHMHAVGGAN